MPCWRSEKLANDPCERPNIMKYQKYDLSGLWKFAFLPAPVTEFYPDKIEFNSFAPVPGCFDTLSEYALQRGTGVYCRKVYIGGSAALTLEGVGLRGKVYWDGTWLADIDGAFSARTIRFNAGMLLEHELVVAVNNEFEDTPAATFHRKYDFYAHGGIYRKVTIKEINEFDLEYLKVTPLDIEKGIVDVEFKLWGKTTDCTHAEVAFDNSSRSKTIELAAGMFRQQMQVANPSIWSPDSPHLHKITVMVNGISFTEEFGLRTVKVKNGEIYLNGKKLFLKGLNRHDSHPDFGYAVPLSIQASDLLMIKAAGYNCIRGSHYPQSSDFLNMCDRLGMLVWEETLGWGNTEESLTDELFQQRQLHEAELMAAKSHNHPSVIMWGFLNECVSDVPSARLLIGKLADSLRKIDRSRPVTFATCRPLNDCCLDLVDIISINTYPGWYTMEFNQFFEPEAIDKTLAELVEFASTAKLANKPLLISEIGAEATLGVRGGQRWSEDYQADLQEYVMQYIMQHPRFSGVMLWQYCDARTYISYNSQWRANGFNRKGLVDEHRQPKEAWRRLSKLLNK